MLKNILSQGDSWHCVIAPTKERELSKSRVSLQRIQQFIISFPKCSHNETFCCIFKYLVNLKIIIIIFTHIK
jgi:hypothetical protein